MPILKNEERVGNFTSSEIGALMTNGRGGNSIGKPAFTYISEKRMERRLGRSLDKESSARPLSWGQLLEKFVFDQLGLEYELVSQETLVHPEFDYWAGSPDALKGKGKEKTVVDIKCPITLKSFCQLINPLYEGHDGIHAMDIVRASHKMGDKYYWQLVSNAILTGSNFAELIIYVPPFSKLQEIREFASEFDTENPQRYYWIDRALDDELPYLPEKGCEYKSINVIRFEVPEKDKKALKGRVLSCGSLLVEG